MEAISEELGNLYRNNTMTFVSKLPKGVKPINTGWIFTVKRNEKNIIYRFKARIVARGNHQIKGINFLLTYVPTLNLDSIKFIIAYACKQNWKIFQLDIKSAYLNADLEEKIYVNIPEGDKNYKKGYWLLNKALYGLKQSGRAWFITIKNFIIKCGFDQLKSEPCIFRKYDNNNNITCLIGIYVDDMIITCKSHDIENIINVIKQKFKISNCGEAKYLLGIIIERNFNSYLIHQRNFIENLLNTFKISNLKNAKTPCTGDNIISENNTPFDSTIYKSALGSLIYLSRATRPDIAFAVNKASRKCENPTYSDWRKIINILKYLNSTKNFKIKYDGQGDFVAYTDADFGGDTKDRKSTSGNIILMGKNPIMWQSKKQTIVATSTAESEYISTSECTKRVLWLRNMLEELINFNKPITIFTDNMASKRSIENGELNTKLKHISIKFYFNYDNIKNNKIKLEYKDTNNMLADILTKDVNGTKMKKFTDLIFVKN